MKKLLMISAVFAGMMIAFTLHAQDASKATKDTKVTTASTTTSATAPCKFVDANGDGVCDNCKMKKSECKGSGDCCKSSCAGSKSKSKGNCGGCPMEGGKQNHGKECPAKGQPQTDPAKK
jgi:hypothetical protein